MAPVSRPDNLKILEGESGRAIGFLYKQGPQVGDHQSIFIRVENSGETIYTFGPLFLPIFPVYFFPSSRIPLDRTKPLELKYFAYSAASMGADVQKLPEPLLELLDGIRLQPIRSLPCPNDAKRCRLFTYDRTVEQVSEFFLLETTTVLADQTELKTPRLHFKLKESTRINWLIQIAP